MRAELKRLLREMGDEGVVAKRHNTLHHPGALPSTVLADVTARDRDGDMIAVPDEWDEEAHGAAPKIRIHTPRKMKPGEAAGIGDKVLLRVEETDEDGGIRHSGRVIKIIDRPKHRILGVFRVKPEWRRPAGADRQKDARPRTQHSARRDRRRARRRPGRGRDPARLALRPAERPRRRTARLAGQRKGRQPDRHSRPLDPGRVPPRNAQSKPRPPNPRRCRSAVEDWRKLPLITIDPPDAKDHDDAVHAEPDDDPHNKGGFILTVAIADVAHYVTPGSALDREALVRGNSVYFPDRVVPMLPERISNDLCSLRPNEDRAALAVRMVIDAGGRKRSHTFHRIMMRSAAKLAYEQAQFAIDGRTDDTTGPLLEPILKPLYAAYEALKIAREERQPLDLDLPERKILLKKDGTVDRVVVPERQDANKLIEEFMILANVAAAETLEKAKVPLVYRVHDEPGPEKINALREFLASLQIPLAKSGALRPATFNRILAQVKGGEREQLINEVVLRSQAQAEYAAENYGHFGLNLRRYAHFTSPIRRYADLIVHRGLIRALKLGPDGLPENFGVPELAEIGAEISATERRAMLAERETKDRLIAHYLADRIGATFEGRVAGVHRAGLFVKLTETGADGFIPARTIGDEFFRHDEAAHAMIGNRSGETYRLGDHVTVKLVEAAPIAGALRFELLSQGSKGSSGAARKKSHIPNPQKRPRGISKSKSRNRKKPGKKPGKKQRKA